MRFVIFESNRGAYILIWKYRHLYALFKFLNEFSIHGNQVVWWTYVEKINHAILFLTVLIFNSACL